MWWIRSDPCGIFSATFTIFLILYSQITIVTVVLLPWYGFGTHTLLYTLCSLLAIISHSRAQFTDPGAVPRNKMAPPNDDPNNHHMVARSCKRCKAVKPSKAHHCSSCARCIVRMDHHCPWVNNCVGIMNQKYFLLFLFYTCLCCIYAGVLLIARFVSCTNSLKTCTISAGQSAMCVINFVEALVFGLFVIIMMFDQFAAIFENTPGIDALQNRKGSKRGWYESLYDVFGDPISWRWLLPLNPSQKLLTDFEMEVNSFEMVNVPLLAPQNPYPIPGRDLGLDIPSSTHAESISSNHRDTRGHDLDSSTTDSDTQYKDL